MPLSLNVPIAATLFRAVSFLLNPHTVLSEQLFENTALTSSLSPFEVRLWIYESEVRASELQHDLERDAKVPELYAKLTLEEEKKKLSICGETLISASLRWLFMRFYAQMMGDYRQHFLLLRTTQKKILCNTSTLLCNKRCVHMLRCFFPFALCCVSFFVFLSFSPCL